LFPKYLKPCTARKCPP